jgi:hypothetical protein
MESHIARFVVEFAIEHCSEEDLGRASESSEASSYRYAMLYYTILYYTVLCYTVLCYAMLHLRLMQMLMLNKIQATP